MVDLQKDPAGSFLQVAHELENARILTVEPQGEVEIQRRGHGREIQFLWEGELVGCTTEEVTKLLAEYKIRSALVKVRGKVSLNIVEDAIFGNAVYRPTIVIANKADIYTNQGTIEQLRQAVGPLEIIITSVQNNKELAPILGEKLFKLLKIARIYTKEPGKDHATIPIVVQSGIKVGDLAKIIHNDFYDRFKYARIWGSSAKFPNEKVGIDRELLDGTIIQLYT
jgi:ribosome-interacting GTPase 1